MNLGLANKVVCITGGSSGIGKAVALAFAKESCQVAICGRNEERLAKTAAEFAQQGFKLYTQQADVSIIADLERFSSTVRKQFGKIDIWINNAGAIEPMPFENMSEEQWHRIVNTNFKSVYYGSAMASACMKKNNGGVIINTSSFAAVMPNAGKALYSATKAAVESLTKSLAIELACWNIRVVSVIPGYIRTEFTADNIAKNYDMLVSSIGMKRLGNPEDLVGAYLFLASDAAAYISGVSLPVTGAKFCTQNPLWSWKENKFEKESKQ